ncbi:inositol 2-dehydrogenase [Jiella pelagia]|uniref:Inositol 2-dehydrogenase n=1 Tax=Jiella pelagia TaxID=2986949 RepID=A0ABY7BUS0_9HYPH|nr:inositol 2-dehydrogenase [Jiella pelagia]WAP66795.1 inositol 2-dehydrogenase [Jiella pelagia]
MARIAVLGCGRIGRMHAANIEAHPRSSLAGVFDVHAPSTKEVAERLKTRNFASAEDIFASNEVDAILIATSTSTHVDYIQDGVAAGKAVLCEKPIDLSLERVNACAQKIAGTSVPVMIGFCRRFDPDHRAARQTVLDGEIGELHQVIITSRDPGLAPDAYIRSSGGIFRDMTIHDLDLARFMLGEEVVAVTAHGSRLVNPTLMAECGDYDTAVVTLVTESGKQAVITNSRQAAYGYDQRIELFGSKGMAISENHHETRVSKHLSHGTDIAAPLENFFIERYRAAFAAEIDNFVDTIEGKAKPEADFEDGRKALILADACFKSVAEARTVEISEFT